MSFTLKALASFSCRVVLCFTPLHVAFGTADCAKSLAACVWFFVVVKLETAEDSFVYTRTDTQKKETKQQLQ
jgi:hypothetical protein